MIPVCASRHGMNHVRVRRALLAMLGTTAALSTTLLGCSGSAPAPDALVAQARSGAWMCVRPSARGKRCNTIVRYTFAADGSVRVQTDVTMSTSVVLSSTVVARVLDDAICYTVRGSDIDSATFIVLGRPATPDETAALRAQVKANIAARPQQEGCMTAALRDGRLVVDFAMDGVPRPELSQPMTWVGADEGYVAAPF